MLGNGSKIPITHVGHAQLHCSSHELKLKGLLSVPQLEKNLISVKQLCVDNNFLWNSFVTHCVKDLKTTNTVLTGEVRDRLYNIYHSSKDTIFFAILRNLVKPCGIINLATHICLLFSMLYKA